jgi:two-component system sensor histidine kinase KdpD
MDETRPDPDALLERVQRAEEKARRGRLRIYFGASAGVGKTFAMLAAGARLKRDGVDVLLGVVETHGRSETAALVGGDGGLEQLPLRDVPYRDRVLKEFDIDAVLARRPRLLLLDELAHSNAPGSRHPKRWQDAEEILAAGIDVFTTLNVQHLESLNDVVGGITGIRVQETIPDTFFDSADEVLLIDLPAEELLKRLDEGKVYIPEQARRAAKGFFRRGNLMALRELALRRTADRLEGDVQTYRSDEAIGPVWKTEAAILCCVGPELQAENVVRATARLASQTNSSWHAIYVETPALQRLSGSERERILRSVRLAEELGADTAVLSNSDADVALGIVEFARTHNLSRIVLGRPQRVSLWPWKVTTARRIAALAPDVDLIELGQGMNAPQPDAPASAAPAVAGAVLEPHVKARSRRLQYLYAVLACCATTAATLPLLNFVHLTNIAMVFLLTVALVAMRWGRGPAVLAAVLNVGAYDFFFVAPRFSFAVSDLQYALTFAVMLAVGLIIAELTARMRYQTRVATHREERARQLYEFSRDLSIVLHDSDVVRLASEVIGRAFRADVHIVAAHEAKRLKVPAALARVPEFEPAIANWAFENQQAAGMGTDTLPGSSWLYLPLKAPMRTRGVLALKPRNRRFLMVPEQRRQLETFAALVAIALERLHYAEVAQTALVGMESERLRNSLLSALSHDLRTPLAAVVGLADSLTLTRPELSAQQLELARAINEEARRMNALVNNLLDMARIESGGISLNLQWQALEEIVGSALQATRHVLAHHKVSVQLAPDLPLVQFDAVLIERVLINLLENAAKYTPAGSEIRISASPVDAALEVVVEDDGPGLPPGREEALFAKFARGEKESAQSGVGLGLAICRAIVGAHGGTIRADVARSHGARFVFTLPLGQPPVVAAEPAESATHA